MPIPNAIRPRLVALLGLILLLVSGGALAQERSPVLSNVPCANGLAGIYPCHNVDLLSLLPLDQMGAETPDVKGNDHWGWTDPISGRHFVVYGLTNGTSFVEVTDPLNPVYLGKLPNHDAGASSVWRDIKVYADHAFIVGDMPTTDGLQVFDLTQLTAVANPPVTFTAAAHYDGFGPGHNLWINEATGYAYVFRSDTCNGGVHMVNVQTPTNPTFAGCFLDNDVPLSDAECVVYDGPDADYTGREICFVGSDDNVTIGDVTDKTNPTVIASFTYNGIVRAHQGSLTEDGRFWLLSDTMDELTNGHNTRTYIFDVADLDAPAVLGFYEHPTTARDHNLYIIDTIAYQTNWRAGLRLLDVSPLPSTSLVEVGYFDVVPGSDSVASSGSWSSYPWWSDGFVTVSTTDQGLFILQPQLEPTDVTLSDFGGDAPAAPWPLVALPFAIGLLWLTIRKMIVNDKW